MKEQDFDEPASLFMLNCLLFTREETISDPGVDRYARKVDGYLTSLLAAFSNPANVEHLTPHLAEYDLEVFRRLKHSDDATVRYTIYKTHRDFLLLSIGRFDKGGEEALPAGPEFKQGNQGQMGSNKGYYHFAFSYSTGEPGTPGEMAEVFKQLSMGFEKYSTILTYSAGMYYDLGERLAEAEVYDLTRATEANRRRSALERKRNEFLDAYLTWKKQRNEAARDRMRLVAEDLRSLDPGFTFKPK